MRAQFLSHFQPNHQCSPLRNHELSYCPSSSLVNLEVWSTWIRFSFTNKVCKHRSRKRYWGHQAPAASLSLQVRVILRQSWWSEEPVSFMKITHLSMPWRKSHFFAGKTKNHDTKEIKDVVRWRDPSASIKLHRGVCPNSPRKWAVPHRTDKSQNSSILVSIWPAGNSFLIPNPPCVSRIQKLSMQDALIS